MLKAKMFLCACLCVLAVLASPAKGDSIKVVNEYSLSARLSDLILYGEDPNKQQTVILAPNDPNDDIKLTPGMFRIFHAPFKIATYEISRGHFQPDGTYWEDKAYIFNVERIISRKLGMIRDPEEQQTVVLAVDQAVAPEPSPEGTVLAFVDGYNELMPGWFVGTDINFDTGEVTGAYTGNVEVFCTAFEVTVLPSDIPAQWNIDFQGDENHNNTYGQTDPVDYIGVGPYIQEQLKGYWNIFEVPALSAPWPGPTNYTTNPSMDLADHEGRFGVGKSSLVKFSIIGDAYGWAGDAGDDPLTGDYLIILNGFGVVNDPLPWRITGLAPGASYRLTYYHRANVLGRGINFVANGVETTVSVPGSSVASTLVTADWVGRITGTADSYGYIEGNWSALTIRTVAAPATNPHPINGAINVPLDAALIWTPGADAATHDLYLGTDSDLVANADTSDTTGIYRARLADNGYNPGTLEPGTIYYWKIDEVVPTVDGPPILYEGDLWSFTTASGAETLVFHQMDFNLSGTIYTDTEWGSVDFTFTGQEPIMYFNLAANGHWQVQNIPVLSVEGAGVQQTMTYYFDLRTARGMNVTSLNYDYAFTPDVLDAMPGGFNLAPVWDDHVAMWPGFGGSMPALAPARPLIGGEVVSSDKKHAHKDFPNQECGENECTLAAISNSLKFLNEKCNLGMPEEKYDIDTIRDIVDWDNGAPDDWWKLKKEHMDDPNNGYPITTRKVTDIGELVAEIERGQDVEIDEWWIDQTTGKPTGHTTALIGITKLKDGRYSLDVADDRKQGEPGGCDNPRPYIYDPNDPNGSFYEPGLGYTNFDYAVVECPKYLVVDDFEDYNDYSPDKIFQTWMDGWGFSEPWPPHPGNGTGSIVGYFEPPFAEQTIVHGGSQSMPLGYDNSGSYRRAFYSETERMFDTPQDWTRYGVEALSLWFFGEPNNDPELMYVAVANGMGASAVVYHDNPDAAQIDTWTEWRIELKEFADQGVHLTDVDRVAIGFGDMNTPEPGGSGMVYIDNIRLYLAQEPEPSVIVVPPDAALEVCPTDIPGFKIRSLKPFVTQGWGYDAMNEILDTGMYCGLPAQPGTEGSRVSQFVNLRDTGNGVFSQANGYPDESYPGIDQFECPAQDPAAGDDDDNFATEILGYIRLSEGLHTIGANSDDGTIIQIGGVEVGRTEEVKGASNVDFVFEVAADGFYLLRARTLELQGGSSIELHEVLPDGTRILLGDVAAGGSPVFAP